MLRRSGFGATGTAIDAAVGRDRAAYLDEVLNLDPATDPGALATPMGSFATPALPASEASTGPFVNAMLAQMQELSGWWVRRMVAVHQPIHEKLTFVWHNHFATSVEKVVAAEFMAAQNQTLRTHALGDFRDLAYAMLTDSAMLRWLDGLGNTKDAPNENLSREFMELFALGHDNGYTERDVREGARALTGRVDTLRNGTQLVAADHDSGTKTVLGVTGPLGDTEFCDIVLAHPASARFVTSKLWRLLASDTDPGSATSDRLVAAYGPDRDLKALVKAIFMDPDFIAGAGTAVVTPVEWLIGMLRSLSVPLDGPQTLTACDVVLKVMGQRPFAPPDVDGWPQGRVWLSNTSAAARVWAADQFVPLGDVSLVQDAAVDDRIDAAGYLLGIGAWSDTTATALKPLAGNPVRLVTAAVNTPEYLTV
ncbi:DUF1800 domain-containing protein [Mycolicibacterium bacteremicum]|uniref:DUF1800 domain-containing protein n=1 Tax=Mycolicibacterium bacteremicum TaxID=564198 RepID=A0A1W9Z0F0_MYCBA|nr:DUF1800 domain-containing protein [Mycolicibacterium bacteremicum]MCV7434593.1 DUF1800 domain-containing protein [Mycolicibacterium bacteremicum]ORA05816.1 hypothetical protein BST17_07470 [Mycolicibacterium bacteremicum]